MGQAVLVLGPAGSGKSTFSDLVRQHVETMKRRVHVVNLDPAAEHFAYPVAADIRELISLEDVMEEMNLGPNGALIYCMEFLVENIDWLQDELEQIGPDEYVLFDCQGESGCTRVPAMVTLTQELQRMGSASPPRTCSTRRSPPTSPSSCRACSAACRR